MMQFRNCKLLLRGVNPIRETRKLAIGPVIDVNRRRACGNCEPTFHQVQGACGKTVFCFSTAPAVSIGLCSLSFLLLFSFSVMAISASNSIGEP